MSQKSRFSLSHLFINLVSSHISRYLRACALRTRAFFDILHDSDWIHGENNYVLMKFFVLLSSRITRLRKTDNSELITKNFFVILVMDWFSWFDYPHQARHLNRSIRHFVIFFEKNLGWLQHFGEVVASNT